MDILLSALAILAPLGVIAYLVYSVFRDVFNYFYLEIRYIIKIKRPMSIRRQNILRKYFAYYNALSLTDQKAFEKRLIRFLYAKTFIARGEIPVTDEMRILISASAIQLVFGLPDIYLDHFDKILIYPNTYYSQITRKYHKGEVNPRAGIIILSWSNFVDGYANQSDSFNVGLHEMAHAIHFENRINNHEYGFFDEENLDKLAEISAREIPVINSNQSHFMRKYAGSNEYEFFAVALEYFFEQPLELKQHIPDLYGVLSKLLNQDPVKLYKLA